jgi:ABC-type multidrug transport system fused ATPase/permease subunit
VRATHAAHTPSMIFPLQYTVYIATALGALSDLFGSLMNALGASDRLFGILDTAPAIPNTGGLKPTATRGLLQLRDVTFACDVPRPSRCVKGQRQ